VVSAAYIRRLNLSASGHYAMPAFAYDWHTRKGFASFYRIWGAALTEVELDVLTGQWRVLRTDIYQDNGSQLNPAVDVGQVEGGFVQGMGLYTIEELLWAKDGHLRTRNVSTYKIPSHDDIPIEFNVSLLRGVTNPRAVKGNKTVGEAGLQLAISVVHAVKDAIYAAKREAGTGTGEPAFFRLDTPATVERVRLACPTPFN
jgi:xanthine dehydrogenase molybdopterin-binding subunit B